MKTRKLEQRQKDSKIDQPVCAQLERLVRTYSIESLLSSHHFRCESIAMGLSLSPVP